VQELKTVIEQIKNYSKAGQKLEKITAYIPKDVKAVLQMLADQGLEDDEELSISSVIAAFLVIGVQHNVNLQYGALLQPVIEKVIRVILFGHVLEFSVTLALALGHRGGGCRCQLLKHGLGILQVGGVEALGKPALLR
jgi:hypothetical protein